MSSLQSLIRHQPMSGVKRIILLLLCLALQACATSGALNVAREQFRHGSAQQALQTLSEANVSRRDRLLLYMDRAMVAQAAGRYDSSVAALDSALRLIDELDYVSLRDQSSALLTSDRAIRYSGEYSERLWVHTFQMINFLLLDEPQSAAVEARRAAAVYQDHGDVLNQDIFTRALMALSFASAGQADSAGVEYRKLQEDFGLAPPASPADDQGELVLFVLDGFIEPKLPGDLIIDINARISFPFYADHVGSAPEIQLSENDTALPFTRRDTRLVEVSREALSERGKRIAARQALRIAAKYQVADAISREDELVGNIARLVFLAIDQADTRSWETLPAWLTLVRSPLSAGPHSVRVRIRGIDAGPLQRETSQTRVLDFDIAPGQRVFRLIRPGISLVP